VIIGGNAVIVAVPFPPGIVCGGGVTTDEDGPPLKTGVLELELSLLPEDAVVPVAGGHSPPFPPPPPLPLAPGTVTVETDISVTVMINTGTEGQEAKDVMMVEVSGPGPVGKEVMSDDGLGVPDGCVDELEEPVALDDDAGLVVVGRPHSSRL